MRAPSPLNVNKVLAGFTPRMFHVAYRSVLEHCAHRPLCFRSRCTQILREGTHLRTRRDDMSKPPNTHPAHHGVSELGSDHLSDPVRHDCWRGPCRHSRLLPSWVMATCAMSSSQRSPSHFHGRHYRTSIELRHRILARLSYCPPPKKAYSYVQRYASSQLTRASKT